MVISLAGNLISWQSTGSVDRYTCRTPHFLMHSRCIALRPDITHTRGSNHQGFCLTQHSHFISARHVPCFDALDTKHLHSVLSCSGSSIFNPLRRSTTSSRWRFCGTATSYSGRHQPSQSIAHSSTHSTTRLGQRACQRTLTALGLTLSQSKSTRMQIGKGRYTFNCRSCFIRGDQSFPLPFPVSHVRCLPLCPRILPFPSSTNLTPSLLVTHSLQKMTRSVGVATLTKSITSCQIKNYFCSPDEQMERCAAADFDLRVCPARDDTASSATSEHRRIEARSRSNLELSAQSTSTRQALMETVNVEVARHGPIWSSQCSACTANIVMEPATHADVPMKAFNQLCPTEWNSKPLQSPLPRWSVLRRQVQRHCAP